MTTQTADIMIDHAHMTTLQRMATYAAWSMAVAVFWIVGWPMMSPLDPLGAVSMSTHGNVLVMFLATAVLAVVVAALATLMAGKILDDAGAFAAMIGLVAISMRGGTSNTMFLSHIGNGEASAGGFAFYYAAEAFGWMVVALLTLVASAATMTWLASFKRIGGPHHAASRMADYVGAMAGFDVPVLGRILSNGSPSPTESWRSALPHTLIVAVVGLVMVAVLSQGLDARSTSHGQSCFVVAIGVIIGCHVAYRVAPTGSSLWSILGVWVMVIAGYLWASTRMTEGQPAAIVPNSFLRLLPIQFVCVGTAAAIFMAWYQPPLQRERQA